MIVKVLQGWCRNCMAWVNINTALRPRCVCCGSKAVEGVHDPLDPPKEML